MASVDFIFDFGSPNAYFVHRVLPGLVERTGASVRYVPCLLGGIFKSTGNAAPMVRNADVPAKMAYDMLEIRRFIADNGLIAFQMNPHFPVNTLLLMRGAVFAEREGFLPHYVESGMRHMWEQPRNMADPDVFVAAFDESGLDGAAILSGTQDEAVKASLAANTQRAVERGAFGIPTFFVGEEMFFGKERLGQVEREIARQGLGSAS